MSRIWAHPVFHLYSTGTNFKISNINVFHKTIICTQKIVGKAKNTIEMKKIRRKITSIGGRGCDWEGLHVMHMNMYFWYV